MNLSLPILLLIVFGVAVGAYAIGVQVAYRTKKPTLPSPSSVVVISDTLADLALRLAKEPELGPFLLAAAEWLRDEYKIPLVVIYPYDPATNELVSPVVVASKPNVPACGPQRRF